MPRFASLTVLALLCAAGNASAADAGRPSDTLQGKVFCGYQGWFRCEGDGSGTGWHHYAAGGKFEPGHAHIEMWPDVSELGPDERFPTPFRFVDERAAEVFSSFREPTVRRHFAWMRDYGIDGAFVQRFVSDTRDRRYRDPLDQVLAHCRAAAGASDRKWALMYDLSGLKAGESTLLIEDWKRLVREGRVSRDGSDEAYLQHRGRPLVALWGLGFKDRATTLGEWSALLTFLREDPAFGGCAIMVGVPYHWLTLDLDCIADPKLHEVFARADIISPWAVGRLATPQDAAGRVESVLKKDIAWCRSRGIEYLPVIFPGFSWHNLSKSRGQEAQFDAIPRRGGQFLWSQAMAARQAGAAALYVAMFDEMDEGTAIFKTTQSPPVGESRFLAEPELPSDHYLWLTGAIGRMLRGDAPVSDSMPARH